MSIPIRTPAAAAALLMLALTLSGCATRPTASDALPAQQAEHGEPAAAAPSIDQPVGARPDAGEPGSRGSAATAPAPGAGAVAAVPATGPAEPLRDGAAVFAALRAQLSGTQCPDDRVVQRWIAFYARAPARLADNLERVLPALAHVLDAVRSAGLPGEFALLPIVESWYRADARNGGTAGMWQFSAGTARAHGLRVGADVDERYSPRKATRAAIEHLAALQERFGDWRLAVMAYNAGEYRVQRALAAGGSARASPAAHQPAGLSTITYEHLAKLLALACVVREPQRIGMQLPTTSFAPMGADPQNRPAEQRYRVRPGDSLWAIARRHGVALADLLRWNALDAKAVLRPGQMLRLRP